MVLVRKLQAVAVPPRKLVTSGTETKSGCLWCPLLPWSEDFEKHAAAFNRDATKVLSKEPEGHTVHSRCVSEVWSKCDVLFVGEAPGADEDRVGTPFIGRSGKLLRNAIQDANHKAKFTVGITNLVRCRPPRNRDPNRTEIQSCAPELIREVLARKPRLVVVLGNKSMEFFTGKTGITTLSGKILGATHPAFPKLMVAACLHPAYILRFDHEMSKFLDAIAEAWSFLDGSYVAKSGEGTYTTLTELSDVIALFESFVESDEAVAFDTETGSLQWWQTEFPPLLSFGFSNKEGTGYCIPYDHAESPWRIGGPKEDEREELTDILRAFFESEMEKIAQNGKFDRNRIRARIGVVPALASDTMTTHLTLDERRGTHGLDALAYSHTGMGGYDSALEEYKAKHPEANPDRGGSYANIPGKILFKYNAQDADVTKRVHNGLRADPAYVKNPKFQRLAEDFLPALSDVLADLEWNGAQIDTKVVDELDVQYAGEMERVSKEIMGLECVKRFEQEKGLDEFNPGSPKQLQTLLFDPTYYGEIPAHLTDTGFERLKLQHKKAIDVWRAGRKGKEPSFTSTVKAAWQRGEYQHFSTNAEALQELDQRGNELASKIVEFRGFSTLHGTFIKPLMTKLDPLGRIHGSFLLHGTVTGRLASQDPNLQNIPNKGEGRVKRAYVSRFGKEGVIASADFSQIELRIAASWFDEPTMIRVYREGGDVHTATALDIAKMTSEVYAKLEKHVQKEWRTRAKRINFGILYQGGPPALVKTLKKDGVFITGEEAERLIERYFQVRPALRAGIEKLQRQVLRDGFLESFTGRLRRVPEVTSVDEQLVARALRQAVNFPIQSGASDMTLMSLVLIARDMKRRNLRSLIILTVHDSIVFDCHVDEFVEVMQLAKEVMETLPDRSEQVLPGLDWSWLKTPIVADCDVGTRWGTAVEFNPFEFDMDELWDRMAEKEAA